MTTPNSTQPARGFRVVHPLDDVHEAKCPTQGLGRMRITSAARTSLFVLRGYLVVMTLMLLYHVLDLAHILPSH